MWRTSDRILNNVLAGPSAILLSNPFTEHPTRFYARAEEARVLILICDDRWIDCSKRNREVLRRRLQLAAVQLIAANSLYDERYPNGGRSDQFEAYAPGIINRLAQEFETDWLGLEKLVAKDVEKLRRQAPSK